MFETYHYSDEWNQEEQENLIKKTVYFMKKKDLPDRIIKPEEFLYSDDGACIGYVFKKPLFPVISLKELFQPKNREEYPIDSAFLVEIARNLLNLLEELAGNDIYPGFLDLNNILVDKGQPLKGVYVSHPEFFQVENIPSSFPWYPSDAGLFEEEFELFDSVTQRKADAKLIYKILTAASRGNAKSPPNQKTQESSWIYWNLLSRDWKNYFLNLKENKVNYEELRKLLEQSYADLRMNSEHRTEDNRQSTQASLEEKRQGKAACLKENREKKPKKKKAYALITILRQAEKPLHDMSRELYLLQEKLESHSELDFDQGFVLGNKHPFTKPFRHYPKGYRSQLGHVISDYSFGEAILIAAEMMEAAQKREERPSVLFLLLDGEIKNDKMFHMALKRLERLTENWYTMLVCIPAGDLKGEGYLILKDICKKGNK